jgi:hypothetical protein
MTTFRSFASANAPADLDFTVDMPADWVVVPLPAETHDFSDVLHFAPVAVLMAPWGAVVFAVAARPAYADGAVAQWLDHVSRQRGLDPGTIEEQPLGAIAGVGCWAGQIEDGTVMRARLAMFEDGDRIVQISCMAPDALWATMAPTFLHMLATFRLNTARGTTAAIVPAGEQLAPNTFTDRPAPAPKPAVAPGPLPLPDSGSEVGAGEDEPTPATAVALAETMQTFDPEHPLNVRMRDAGAGLVPNVLDHHDQERWATLGPGSLLGTMRVPFGWHVIDDGRRALIFDAGGHTQVSMQLLRRDGRTDEGILGEKVPELQKEWPAMRHLRTAVLGMQCLLVRDAQVDGKPIEQAYLLRPAPRGLVLQTRVTSSPEHFSKASDLAEVLLRDLQFAGEAE